MADIKEIFEQTGKAAGKVVKSPLFLAVCGVGIIILLWDSGNKGNGSGQETVTFSEATGYDGYPDVSGDVSTLADNMSVAMQDMMDVMTDSYLQMQEQNAENFEKMNEVIDNKISNMEFVQKENISAMEDNYAGALSGIFEQLEAAEKKASDAEAAAAKAQKEAEAAKKASTTTSTKKTTSSSSTKKTSTKKTTSSSSTKKVTDKVVNAVIRGDYGNGEARKKALEKAGYSYSAVQSAVNKKLAK